MIDWLSAYLAREARYLRQGRIVRYDAQGEQMYAVDTWNDVEGSYSSQVKIRKAPVPSGWWRQGMPECCLQFSGNPVKMLQPHNVIGPSVVYLPQVADAVVDRLALQHPDLGLGGKCEVWGEVSPLCTRVDATVSVWMGSQGEVRDWLMYALNCSRSRSGKAEPASGHERKGMLGWETVYWQKHSRFWSMKAYSKYAELVAHPVKDERLQKLLLEQTLGLLRIELTLRGEAWKVEGVVSEELVWKYLQEKITFSEAQGGVEMSMSNYDGLTKYERVILENWMSNHDVRETLGKSSFYRVRAAILHNVGFDIANPAQPQILALRAVARDRRVVASLREREAKDSDFSEVVQSTLWKPGSGPEKPKEQMELDLA